MRKLAFVWVCAAVVATVTSCGVETGDETEAFGEESAELNACADRVTTNSTGRKVDRSANLFVKGLPQLTTVRWSVVKTSGPTRCGDTFFTTGNGFAVYMNPGRYKISGVSVAGGVYRERLVDLSARTSLQTALSF